jgi:hypothetical protein
MAGDRLMVRARPMDGGPCQPILIGSLTRHDAIADGAPAVALARSSSGATGRGSRYQDPEWSARAANPFGCGLNQQAGMRVHLNAAWLERVDPGGGPVTVGLRS